jgi:site-specific DNA recombinase
MTTRFVTYARYSSDLQSPASIEDQERVCRADAERRNFDVEVRNYADRRISGSGSDREAFQKMMRDALSRTRDFNIIMMDDTSRFSRSFSEAARLHEILKHHGIRVICVSQGIDTDQEQSEMQLAMHGIIDSVYVKELGKKTHRGLEGRFLKGKSAGGRCFGYDPITVAGEGTVWIINEAQAAVLREIFEWSAHGFSLKSIVRMLNERGTPPPQKRADRPFANWCPTAIRAMLRNEIYIGKRIWNRTKFVKVPGTNKRTSRLRPRTEWKEQDVPELRIIPDDLWIRVREAQERRLRKYAAGGQKPVSRAANSPYLLSGFLVCGTCGANLIIVSGGKGRLARYGCPQHWNRHTCSNKFTIRRAELEADFFKLLQVEVLTPEALKLIAEIVAKAQKQRTSRSDHEKQLQQLKNEQANIVAAIAKLGHSEALLSALQANEADIRKLSVATAELSQLTPDQILAAVKERVWALPELLQKDPVSAKMELSAYIDKIRMVPQSDGTYVAEGTWDLLAGWGPVYVAGAGFEPATFGL